MSAFKCSFNVSSHLNFTIKHISDSTKVMDYRWIPITHSAEYSLFRIHEETPLFLPKLYAGLVYLSGEGRGSYDDYKGGYGFSFELEVQKNGIISHYCYYLYQYRSFLRVSLYHRVLRSDPRDMQVMSQPNDELFSDNDIGLFTCALCERTVQSIEKADCKPKQFVKGSASDLILFGFLKGKYFCESFRSSEQYREEKERKEKQL